LRGASWSKEGVIVFAPTQEGGLMRVAAAGGAVSPVTRPDAGRHENSHRFPWFLPDGRHFLFSEGVAGSDRMAIRVGTLDSPESNVLVAEADSNGVYSQGYLLFLRESTLMAQPFDPQSQTLNGEAAPIAESIQHGVGFGNFAASAAGLLVYQASAPSVSSLNWIERSGKRLATVGNPAFLGAMHLSPDRRRAAISVTDGKNADIWIYDLGRGLRTRFTFGPSAEGEAVWSSDGRAVVFSSIHKGHYGLYRKAADGTGAEQSLYADDSDNRPSSWSPDGRFLLYDAAARNNPRDIWVLPLAPGAKPFPLVQTPFAEWNAQFSPDGQWVAYQSNESGQTEIYVIPFHPGGVASGGKTQVSTAGGTLARWRRDGKELFFIAPDRTLMAAEVGAKGGVFEVGQVTPLFGPLILGQGYQYDVSADGQRFLAVLPPEQNSNSEPLTVVQNWTAGLKK
jgi:hypothetical protein